MQDPAPPGEATDALAPLGETEQRLLLDVARGAVTAALAGGGNPEPDPQRLTPRLREPQACFVTLTQQGELRGCIGQLVRREPLWQAVSRNAERAATRDFRFPTLLARDLPTLRVEVSVLSSPRPLEVAGPDELLARLRPGVDGVVLDVGGRSATFLPQVWDDIPDKEAFLSRLAQKAGCDPQAWRTPEARVSVYQVEHFEEAGV